MCVSISEWHSFNLKLCFNLEVHGGGTVIAPWWDLQAGGAVEYFHGLLVMFPGVSSQ